jgi:hypothetical protein
MSFEELDQRAIDAAAQYHPPYEEAAWGRMEKLLDTHLPQDGKKRRRAIFWWWPLALLLAGGGAWLAIAQPWKTKTSAITTTASNVNKTAPATTTNQNNEDAMQVAQADAPTQSTAPAAPVTESVLTPETMVSDSDNDKEHSSHGAGTIRNKNKQRGNLPAIILREQPERTTTNARLKAKRTGTIKKRNTAARDESLLTDPDNDINKNMEPQKEEEEAIPAKQDNHKAIISEPATGPTPSPVTTAPTDKMVETTTSVSKKITPVAAGKKNKFGNRFLFTVSAGPDVSKVSDGYNSHYRTLAGAGIGYRLGSHWLVRAGLYQANKVYGAAPEDYKPTNPPAQPWGYTLKQIDARCRVLQAPVSVSYLLRPAQKHSWLLTGGIASVWMKKEAYDYQYKTSYGGYRHYQYSFSNQNKHLFSMLHVSAGYQYRINNNFSVMAEPYANLPLSGVGNGRVKLKSAGLLVSAAFKPFAKK